MSQTVEDRLQAGKDAFTRHAWREALEHLQAADEAEQLGPEDLEMLAQAGWFGGHPEATIEARERAHNLWIERGDRCEAASAALRISKGYFDRQEMSLATGWLGRAGRLLEEQPECSAHALQALTLSFIAHVVQGDLDEAVRQAERAVEIATRLGDASLQALGLESQGMALVAKGRVEEGTALVDEATAAAVGGGLDPFTTGDIYCMTISACRDLADYRRAGEWTDAAERWCARQGIAGFPGVCRVHRAEIMHLRGAWADAEREARKACLELERYDLNFTAAGFYEIGEIRLRVGDLPGAEEAFRQAHSLNRDPEPGMSLLRLAQGDVESAAAGIKRALEDETLPALTRSRLLPARVEIGIAAGDLDGVREAIDELERIAETFGTTALQAVVAFCRGVLLRVEGDGGRAAKELRRAVELWNQVGAPYEVARARMALGEAYRAGGDEKAALLELKAAQAAFERLGAGLDLRRMDELLGAEAAGGKAGERVTRTFMFTDIVGSTSLIETIGDEAWENVLDWHDRTLRAELARHGGEIVKHGGDGFVATFADPVPAVECAVAIQRALAEHRKKQGFAPQVRIGLHATEATRKGMDFAGKGVHQAARIGALAEGGEILVSRSTVDGSRIRYSLSEPRAVTLKGIAEPVEVVTVEWR